MSAARCVYAKESSDISSLQGITALSADEVNNDSGWQCVYVDRGHEEHRGGHVGRGRTRSIAADRAKAACLEDHGRCRESSCKQADNPQLRQARARLVELKRDHDQIVNGLERNRDLQRQKRSAIAQLDSNIRTCEERAIVWSKPRDLNSAMLLEITVSFFVSEKKTAECG